MTVSCQQINELGDHKVLCGHTLNWRHLIDRYSGCCAVKNYFHALYVLRVQAMAARAAAFAKRLSSADRLSHTKHDQAAKGPSLPSIF